MVFSRNSKIREIWRHPVGHDVLHSLLCQLGRNERWAQGLLAGGLPVSVLDKIGGAGVADMLLSMVNSEPDRPAPPPENEPRTWWKESVIYQIYPPSFMDSDHDGVGDLCGILQRLPYLVKLGVDALCLWPILDTGAAFGRGVRDFTKVSPDLGTVEDFEALAKAAHERGLRVLMGMDISNTSDEHPWFISALEGADEQNQERYFLCRGMPDAPPNNWGRAGAGVWTWYPALGAWGLRLTGRHKMDLNWDNPEVRTYMASVLNFWQDKGVDGFFFGSANLISKSSMADGCIPAGLAGYCGYEHYAYGSSMHRYLKELRAEMNDDSVLMAGEVRGVGTEMAKLFTGAERSELNMVLDGSHLIPSRVRGEELPFSLYGLKRYYLRWMEQYGAEQWMSLYLENAETSRITSRVGASPVYRGIVAKMLATMLFTLRGTPVVYQGQELGLANARVTSSADFRDPAAMRRYNELRERVGEKAALEAATSISTDHVRFPMPWSAGPRGGFTGAEPWMRLPDGVEHLNAAAQMEDVGSVWRHYQKLIALRKKHIGLVYGSFNPVFVNNKRAFCYFRIYEGSKWYVEMNLSEKECTRPGRILRTQKLVLSNYETPVQTLRPYEANVYKCE